MGRIVRKVVELSWVCECCGTKMLGRYRDCSNCGSPRDKGTTFDKSNPLKTNLSISEVSEPDWCCEFCDSLNNAKEDFCVSCGAPKSNTTYFDLRKNEIKEVVSSKDKMSSVTKDVEEFNPYNTIFKDFFYKEKEETNFVNEDTNIYEKVSQIDDISYREIKEEKIEYSIKEIPLKKNSKVKNAFGNFISCIFEFIGNNLIQILKFIGCSLAFVGLIVGLFFLFRPKTLEVTVEDFIWNRNIEIEKLTTVKESDWEVPSGARVYDVKKEYYGQDYNIYYVEEEVTYTEKVKVGTDLVLVGTKDLGNGYAEEIYEEVDIYEEVTKTEMKEVPKKEYFDVYKDKYYYEIDKYIFSRNVRTSGSDKSPYWGEYSLDKKEKLGSTTESYQIKVKTKDNQYQLYSLNFEEWKLLNKGDELIITVSAGVIINIERK